MDSEGSRESRPGRPTAFVSHASADDELAGRVVAGLEARGFDCWIDHREIRAGGDYAAQIMEGIAGADYFVLLLTDASNRSGMVAREVERAASKDKPFITLRMDDVRPSPSLEFFISSRQWVDATSGSLEDHVDRIARDITERAGRPEPAPPDPTPPPRFRRAAGFTVGGVLSLILGFAVFQLTGSTFDPGASVPGEAGTPGGGDATSTSRDGGDDPRSTSSPASADVRPADLARSDFDLEPSYSSLHFSLDVNLSGRARTLLRRGEVRDQVEYSFDGETFFQETANYYPGQVSDLPEAERVYLRFRSDAGEVIGPFRYDVDLRSVAFSDMKDHLAGMTLNCGGLMGGQEVCLPYDSHAFMAVDSIRYGPDPGLDDARTLRVPDPTWEMIRDGLQAGGYGDRGQNALVRFEVAEGTSPLYARYYFRDGEVSGVQRISAYWN